MRSKTYMSNINLQAETTTVENRKSREKTDMLRSIGKKSGESVVSPGEEMVSYGGKDLFPTGLPMFILACSRVNVSLLIKLHEPASAD